MNFMAVVKSTTDLTLRLHNIGIYSTVTRPARHREPEAKQTFLLLNHDLFRMLLCVLSRISDVQDLGDR